MSHPAIEVVLDGVEMSDAVEAALRQVSADVQLTRLADLGTHDPPRFSDARLVLTRDAWSLTNGRLERLIRCIDRDDCATLVLSEMPLIGYAAPRTALAHRTVSFASRISRDDLAGRLIAMCALHGRLGELRNQLLALQSRERTLSQDLASLRSDLHSAAALQRKLHRSPQLRVHGAELHAVQRATQEVSGDSYRVVRIDREHVAVSLGDATGHGVAAALMCEFVHHVLLAGGQRDGRDLRLDPARMLTELNAAIVNADLPDCQFVTLIYAVYHEPSGVIRWARGGAPFPLHLRPGKPATVVTSEGPLLGALESPRFEVAQLTLQPGESWLAHTDGLIELVGDPRDANRTVPAWVDSRLAKHDDDLPLRLDASLTELATDAPADDVTVVALQRAPAACAADSIRSLAPSNPVRLAVPA